MTPLVQREKSEAALPPRVALKDVCQFVRGVGFQKHEVRLSPDQSYLPVLRAGNIQMSLDTVNDLVWVPSARISDEQKLRFGDIAICLSSGSASVVGKTAQLRVPFEGAVGAFCGIVRPRDSASADYLGHWFRSGKFLEWRDSQARGANIQNLRFSMLESVEIPWPSVAEQKRIVTALNERMATVEAARSALEVQVHAASLLRIAILREAFESQAARAWPLATVGEISRLIIDGPHVTPTYISTGVPFVTVRNIVTRKVDLSDLRYISEADHREFSRRGKAEPGDILYTKDGTLGIPCVVEPGPEFSFFVSVALIKLDHQRADPGFVALALDAPATLEQVGLLSAGAGLKHMVLKSIRALKIPLPPMEVQGQMSARLRETLAASMALETKLNAQLSEIEAMPAALLRAAFTGSLKT